MAKKTPITAAVKAKKLANIVRCCGVAKEDAEDRWLEDKKRGGHAAPGTANKAVRSLMAAWGLSEAQAVAQWRADRMRGRALRVVRRSEASRVSPRRAESS